MSQLKKTIFRETDYWPLYCLSHFQEIHKNIIMDQFVQILKFKLISRGINKNLLPKIYHVVGIIANIEQPFILVTITLLFILRHCYSVIYRHLKYKMII